MSELDLTAATAAALVAFDEADQLWPEEVAHVGTAHVVNPRYLEGLAQQVLPLMAHRMLEAALPHLREQLAQEERERLLGILDTAIANARRDADQDDDRISWGGWAALTAARKHFAEPVRGEVTGR